MEAKKVHMNDKANIEIYLKNLNIAYKDRSNEHIPFEEITLKEFMESGFDYCIVLYDNYICAGACIRNCKESNVLVTKINYLWVHPDRKRKGLGNLLIKKIIEDAIQNCNNMIQLNVASNYKPAVNLYKKNGFKTLLVYANIPKTYHFIRMIKTIEPFKYSWIKRWLSLVKSKIIFSILYKSDSSPRMIKRLLYGKKC